MHMNLKPQWMGAIISEHHTHTCIHTHSHTHTHTRVLSMSEDNALKASLPIIVLHPIELASDSNTAYN